MLIPIQSSRRSASKTDPRPLLEAMRDPNNHTAWKEFFDTYSPFIYGMARRKGLQDADAENIVQDVLRAIFLKGDRFVYDPDRGPFLSWLAVVTRNKVINALAIRRRIVAKVSDEFEMDHIPLRDAEVDCDWEHCRRTLSRAMIRVRENFSPKSWRAFWLTAIEGLQPKTVSERLGLSLGAVYVARSRVQSRLREEVKQIEGQHRIAAPGVSNQSHTLAGA